MQPSRPSNVIAFQQRPSKADSVFPGIVAQENIDAASADEKNRERWRFVGVFLCVCALVAFALSHLAVGWLFLGGYAITKGVEYGSEEGAASRHAETAEEA